MSCIRTCTAILPLLTLCWFLVVAGAPARAEDQLPRSFSVEFTTARPLLRGMAVPVSLIVWARDGSGQLLESFEGHVALEGVVRDGQEIHEGGPFERGQLVLEEVVLPRGEIRVRLEASGARGEARRTLLPGWLTLLPPLLAILLALVTRQVLLALFCGVWAGALLIHGLNPVTGFFRSADTYLVGSLADPDHAHIILFSLSLAGMVGVISASGGVNGIVQLVSRYARGPRSGQLATGLLGILIFFDDYANALIVGNTMRPFTDRVRISREKLSFLVDATAAPIATVGIISTWTAYQLGLVADVLPDLEALSRVQKEPYLFFLASIPYSFYSLLMLFLVFLTAVTLRDFGPMRKAEQRTRSTGQVLREGAQPLTDTTLDQLASAPDVTPHWYNAAIPIFCVVGFTLLGLYITGSENLGPSAGLADIVGHADAYRALLWASLGASIVAILLGIFQGRSLAEMINSWISGAKSLMLAVMILVLAWSISAVCKEIHTGAYVADLTRGFLSPRLVPVLAFVTAGVIAFATGTSYGTMGILIPVLLPLVDLRCVEAGLPDSLVQQIGPATLAAILGGAVFGDHCSPISDTTVLSSMASGSDHIDHVRTQLPYALLVAAVGAVCFTLVGVGLSLWIVLLLGMACVAGAFLALSRRTE